ncbi:ribonuclease PH [Thermodesulfovibrionales bacterium]|nr:ribonuclease PH [Thermodesulfovibrionales bacterium]MCL0068516.1 ribonuclease PH [Thermodesulfovibrionales bacterium]
MRTDGRKNDELRKVKITRNSITTVNGSILIEVGDTKVICTASIEDRVPPFLRDQKRGWLTAEYGMLPRATHIRTARESTSGRVGGRTHEIQRLIGRSLRAIIDFKCIGERTMRIDCDVIQADGGTRTASITGAFIALHSVLQHSLKNGTIEKNPIKDYLAAVSVGIINSEPRLDLCYAEDSSAEVDMNVVMEESGKIVEIQGTAETRSFSRDMLNSMVAMAEKGISELIKVQKEILRLNVLKY